MYKKTKNDIIANLQRESIYGNDDMGRYMYEMDKAITEKIMNDMKIERELSKRGHLGLGNKQKEK